MTFCRPLAQQLLSGLTKRHGDFLGLKEEDPTIKMAILATTSHPNFKLRWLTIKKYFNNPDAQNSVTKFFKAALKEVGGKCQEKIRSVEINKECTEDEFFSFEPSQLDEPKETLSQDVEMLTYFSDACTDITCLEKYLTTKEVLMQ